jgi:hypothetical protein
VSPDTHPPHCATNREHVNALLFRNNPRNAHFIGVSCKSSAPPANPRLKPRERFLGWSYPSRVRPDNAPAATAGAARPCRKAIKIMVLSRWPHRLPWRPRSALRPRAQSDARACSSLFGLRSGVCRFGATSSRRTTTLPMVNPSSRRNAARTAAWPARSCRRAPA